MSYTIASVVVGAQLNFKEGKVPDYDELDKLGVEFGEDVFWVGVELCEFDECQATVVSELTLKPTADQVAEAKKKLEDLPEKYKKLAGKFDVYIMWRRS